MGMCEQRKDVHVRWSSGVYAPLVGVLIPCARLRDAKSDLRELVLMPALDVGRRLDFNTHAIERLQIVWGPLLADAVSGDSEGLSNKVLREYPPGHIAHD